jgi:acetoin utilization deacetylase AcuC-like enzyme
MQFIAWHPIYKHTLPEGHRFPMMKYELIKEQLLHNGTVTESAFFSPEITSLRNLMGVHSKEYVTRLLQLKLTASEIRRIGFPLNKNLIERELRIVQGTIDGTKIALNNGLAFNVAGGTHHSGSFWGEGFCLLNDQAIAANHLLKNKSVKKIVIIDLDVHQGNGTAEIFKNQPAVFTFSMHGQNNFPFRKEQSNLDVGLPDGTSGDIYLEILQQNLKKIKQTFQAEFVFYQSGVDVLASDKLGRMKLSKEECATRDKIVFEFCKKHQLPVQVSMGGGYSFQLKDIVDAHCQTFQAAIQVIH